MTDLVEPDTLAPTMKTGLLGRPWTVHSATRRHIGGLSDLERLTAGWLGLTAVLVLTRFLVLYFTAQSSPGNLLLPLWLPLAIYQDLMLVTVLGGSAWVLLRYFRSRGVRYLVRTASWALCLTSAFYAALSTELYNLLSTPLTFRLLALSDHLRGIRNSVAIATTATKLTAILAAPLFVVLCAISIACLAPCWLRNTVGSFYRRRALGGLLIYLFAAHLWASSLLPDSSPVKNPHWALLSSIWERDDPFLNGEFPTAYFGDFLPSSQRSRGRSPELRTSNKTRFSSPAAASSRAARVRPPLNVLMVAMESVGAQYLELCGARYRNTPELVRLAERGVNFSNIYASRPYTSSAMASIFCSVYPYHGTKSLPRRSPGVPIPGLASVLAKQGYRTAFLHTGDLEFDQEREFLRQHGFGQVHDIKTLPGAVELDLPVSRSVLLSMTYDRLLLPAAFDWIQLDRSVPFFLALWTMQSHHPYVTSGPGLDFGVPDPELNRYLNTIRSTDALIGQLVRELEKRGLADDTLLVILGDHGDAFGQHGKRIHGQTLYQEEVAVPLLLVNPQLFPESRRVDRLGQQIDIPPTILSLLDIPVPQQWQGRSLFAQRRPDRAYLFTSFNRYLFGLVQQDFKYIYDASTGKRELYNLKRDPEERTNLLGRVEHAARAAEAHRRLAAWVGFQNNYLVGIMRQRPPFRGLTRAVGRGGQEPNIKSAVAN